MRWIAIILIAFLASVSIWAQDDIFNIIFKQDFENDTPGLYNAAQWKADWNNPSFSNGLDKTYIILSADGNKSMQWNYPAGSVGPTDGGGQFEPEIVDKYDEIYFSYNLKFKPGFEWVLGGKLPGLTGGPHSYYPGVQKPAWDDGFSNGLMWGHGYGGQDDAGGIYFYTYYQDMPDLYGQSFGWGKFKFQTDPEKWYNITIRMVMNTVKADGSGGNSDGIMEGFIDGKLLVSKSGMRFRNTTAVHINKMKIYSHFGGSGAEYGAARNEWSEIDDVIMFTYANGVNVPRGNTPSPAGRILQLPNRKDTVSSELPDTQPPSKPQNLTIVNKTEQSLFFKWSPSSDNLGVAGYKIWINDALTEITESTNILISGLTAGKTYSIAVSAFDEALNESSKSEVLIATTSEINIADTEPPSSPEGLMITAISAESTSFSWSPATDNTGVAGYYVFLNRVVKGNTDSTTFTLNGLEPNTEYHVTISAYDSSNNFSPESQVLEVTTGNVASSDQDLPPAEENNPEVNIIEVRKDTENNAKTISEISFYGNSGLHRFGLMVNKYDDSEAAGILLNAEQGMYRVINDGRITKNLQVLYNFSEGTGNEVKDISGEGTSQDLRISNSSVTEWLSGQGLKITGNTVITSNGLPTGLIDSLSETNEITLETWISPSNTNYTNRGGIISISGENNELAATIGISSDIGTYDFDVRLNTTSTDSTGIPECSTSGKFTTNTLQHVSYTRDKLGNEKIYINGTERYAGVRSGNFSSWGRNLKLMLANDMSGNYPWQGAYFLVAIYNRALSNPEIMNNYKAGYGKLQFNSVLENLQLNTLYFLRAFAETDQGMHYGDAVEFTPVLPGFSDGDSIQMNVYPNPSNGIFSVSFRYTEIDHADIRITDMYGKVVSSTRIQVNNLALFQEEQFSLSDQLKTGIYFVTLILGTSVTAKKLIILH